jgi:hypothetical protein
MQIQFTAVFRKVPEGYVGFVEELPGANTQEPTLVNRSAPAADRCVLLELDSRARRSSLPHDPPHRSCVAPYNALHMCCGRGRGASAAAQQALSTGRARAARAYTGTSRSSRAPSRSRSMSRS